MSTENSESVKKTRHLSANDFFEILQEEYIVCELRVKIFPYENHRQYWKDIAAKKKIKIMDIAKRNSLPCIFDNKRMKETFESKIIPEIGFPKFYYIDDRTRVHQEMWDKRNYYSKEAQVKIVEKDNILIGEIVSADIERGMVTVNVGGKTKEYDIRIVTRILTQLEIKS